MLKKLLDTRPRRREQGRNTPCPMRLQALPKEERASACGDLLTGPGVDHGTFARRAPFSLADGGA
jgi:hypothetical protein